MMSGSWWNYQLEGKRLEASGYTRLRQGLMVQSSVTRLDWSLKVSCKKNGSGYDKTFCPVARQESLRVLIALSVQYGLKLHQVDVTTAFLNGNLEEEVYMTQPKGFVTKGEENRVCKLKKSIYGLKQSPLRWNTVFDSHLKEMGFTQSTSDPCIYMDAGGDVFYMGVYVDDIILAGRTDDRIKEVIATLSRKFDIKDMGELHHFLGMIVMQDKKQISVWVGQTTFTENLSECRIVSLLALQWILAQSL